MIENNKKKEARKEKTLYLNKEKQTIKEKMKQE